MSPDLERACMAAVGLVPIAFNAPDAHESCAGKMRLNRLQKLGICTTCQRPSNDGPQMQPAARIVGGAAECLNHLPIACHALNVDARGPAGKPPCLGGVRVNRFSSTRDVTANVRGAQPSQPHPLLYIACSHKGLRAGGKFRGGLPMLCPACCKEREHDKAA